MTPPRNDHRRGGLSCPCIAGLLLLSIMSFDRLARGGDLAAPPMPPVPEDVRAEPKVQPASLEVATPLPLGGSARPAGAEQGGRSTTRAPMGNWSVLAAIASAFVVLAAIRFWQTRRISREVPSDVFEVLGEAPLGGQHAVRIVRFGPRTLLVGISSAGCQTLATLDDPQATDRIVAACASSRAPRSSRPARAPQAAGTRGSREAR